MASPKDSLKLTRYRWMPLLAVLVIKSSVALLGDVAISVRLSLGRTTNFHKSTEGIEYKARQISMTGFSLVIYILLTLEKWTIPKKASGLLFLLGEAPCARC